MKKSILFLLLFAVVGVLWAADTVSDGTVSQLFNRRPRMNNNVWETVITAVFDVTDTTDVTQAVKLNGTIQKVILEAPDGTDDSVTYQVQILDDNDVVIFDSGEQAENVDYAFSLSEPVTGTFDVVIGVSDAMGATNPDIVVTLRGI